MKKIKDGFYLVTVPKGDWSKEFTVHKKIYSSIDDGKVEKYIEYMCGEWSEKTANKWSKYGCAEFKKGELIDCYTW